MRNWIKLGLVLSAYTIIVSVLTCIYYMPFIALIFGLAIIMARDIESD